MDLFTGWTLKELITLAASGLAVIVSIASYRQKAGEGKIALRKQLAEVLEKLSDQRLEQIKFSALPEVERERYPKDYHIFFQERRRFFVRQGVYLVEKIPELVSPFEYLLLAGDLDRIGEDDQAQSYYILARKRLPLFKHVQRLLSSGKLARSVNRGIALRAYARYLFGKGYHNRARKEFRSALAEFSGHDRRTYEIWADLEEHAGNTEEATRLRKMAHPWFPEQQQPALADPRDSHEANSASDS
jgi:hypothetical protein